MRAAKKKRKLNLRLLFGIRIDQPFSKILQKDLLNLTALEIFDKYYWL